MKFNQVNNQKGLQSVGQWDEYACACMEFLVLRAVGLIYQWGGKQELYVWSVQRFLLPPFPTLCFPLCISVTVACLIQGVGAHGWLVRFCQPSVRSPSWNWMPIVQVAPGCLGHPTSTNSDRATKLFTNLKQTSMGSRFSFFSDTLLLCTGKLHMIKLKYQQLAIIYQWLLHLDHHAENI